MSPQDVLAKVADALDGELVGIYESQEIEFKGQYRLTEQAEKWELAKDVAGLANAGGGVIVVGIATEVDADRAEERVTAVRPLPAELFDRKQFADTVAEWVYPPPHVDIVRHPREEKALGTIRVPPQDTPGPFLVTRIPTDEGRYPAHTGIGWPVRRGSHTMWTPVGLLHSRLAEGEQGQPSSGDTPTTNRTAAPVDLDEALNEVDAFMSWADHAVVYLIAEPTEVQPLPIPGFYAPDGIHGAIERPFELRWAGFGLTYGSVQIDESGRLLSSDEERLLIISPNGPALAALSATPYFLTRGSEAHVNSGQSRSINPVVVTEWTYLFCRFVMTEMVPRTTGEWQLRIGLRGAKTRPWPLNAKPGNWTDHSLIWMTTGNEPGLDNWDHVIPATLDAGRDAYDLLTALYNVFGLEYDEVKLSVDNRVDPDLIAALGRH